MVEHFKNELRNYLYYCNMLDLLNERLDDTWYELEGVKAIRYDKLPSGFDQESIRKKQYELSAKIEKLNVELLRLTNQLKYINDVLSFMDDEEIRSTTIKVYIKGESLSDVGEEVYMSASTLYRKINKSIEESIERYENNYFLKK